MSYKNIRILLDEVRTSAEEKDVTDTTGITDAEIIRFINQGQNIIYRKLLSKSQALFTNKVEIPLASNQSTLDMPKNVYAKNRIRDVKVHLKNGIKRPVRYATEKHDIRSCAGVPRKYYRQSGKIHLTPKNNGQANKLEISFVESVPTLDVEAAYVGSVSINNNQITSLILDNTKQNNMTKLNQYTDLCIVKKNGEITASGIVYDSVDTSTGEIITSHTLMEGETISPGDLILIGTFSSVRTTLPEDVVDFVVEYSVMKILQRQSSADIAIQAQLVKELIESILETYSHVSDDVPCILVHDYNSEGYF